MEKPTNPRFKDLTGRTFGRLTVVNYVGVCPPHQIWTVQCVCGNTKEVRGNALATGYTQSCGCLHKERTAESHLKHGMAKTPVYNIWCKVIQRCTNPNDKSYANYGGRGIAVCSRWLSFENFLADMGDVPQGMSIERKDNDRGYEPSNCEWATRIDQNNNTRRNRFLTFQGKTQTIAQWAREKSIRPSTLYRRIYNGWSVEKAFTS